MARSNPSSAQYQLEERAAARRSESENPARPQRAVHPGEQRGPFGGQEVPERSEADRQVEGPSEGQGPDVGPHPPGAGAGTARLREHASAEVDARDRSLAHGSQDLQPAPVPQHT